ncbi:hypothetical protein PCC7418_2815 [Halothece sp. PCC 7418]|nr:hypothetical protein PCC7418_2815 [Halothece sp. PCC 7418]
MIPDLIQKAEKQGPRQMLKELKTNLKASTE